MAKKRLKLEITGMASVIVMFPFSVRKKALHLESLKKSLR